MGHAEDQFPRDVALSAISYNALQYDYNNNYGHVGPVNYVCMKLTQIMGILRDQELKRKEVEETAEAFEQRLEEMHLELNRERELHKQRQQYAAETHERELAEMKQQYIEMAQKASDLELRLSAINRTKRLGEGLDHMAGFLRTMANLCEESAEAIDK